MIRRSIALVALLGVMAPEPVPADEIKRRALADFPISSSVEVPGGRTLVFLSGTVPDVADPDAAPGTTERYGDTATQAASVLTKLERELQALGMTMANVVKMNVFMIGDPRKGGVMDFDGLMAAYGKHFGTATQKNLPARTTCRSPVCRSGVRSSKSSSSRHANARAQRNAGGQAQLAHIPLASRQPRPAMSCPETASWKSLPAAQVHSGQCPDGSAH